MITKKLILVSDIHGANLLEAYKLLSDRNPFAMLGDLDRAENAYRLEKLLKENSNVFYTPGNHEYAHVNMKWLNSPMLVLQGFASDMLWGEWDKPELKKLVMSSYENKFEEEFPDHKGRAAKIIEIELESGGKLALMHAALYGKYRGEPHDLWYRLKDEINHKDNFFFMSKKGYEVMIRGHDHIPELAILEGNKVEIIKEVVGKKFDITNKTVTITVGTLFNGYYAVFEDGKSKRFISFHQDERLSFKDSIL